MPPKHRLIIDTDPGVDDTLALLLALSANPTTLTVDLITVTHGNVPVATCLRNVVALFHHIELEMAWRKRVGRPEGFDMLRAAAGGRKPIVAVGAGAPLAEQAVTPVAEFNTYADSVAAARVYALTSRYPRMTMPVVPPTKDGELASGHLGPYPEKLSRRLRVTLFPLDITTTHWLRRGTYNKTISPHLTANSPLAKWTTAFLTSTFNKMESLHQGHTGDDTGLSLHDPLCIWYLLTLSHPDWAMTLSEPLDLRVETAGQWTRGMYVVDRRDRFRKEGGEGDLLEGGGEEEVVGDAGRWLDGRSGNGVFVAVGKSHDNETKASDTIDSTSTSTLPNFKNLDFPALIERRHDSA
ncbi:hypothetical protein EG328_005805 [Venturia inaequalis]|uniref:Inosine/uridine-preferring nucleoside hydrolase domain-containing protein n=1 Tax=Venturia inaequalis TaxID=5025 RepID=A0A8H3UKU4_VENIN|nr:hypothetical protein EG328_005805 [Venturia inaequalis]